MFNNKKSRQALTVIISTLVLITILFNNTLTIHATESTESINNRPSTGTSSYAADDNLKYSPVLQWIAKNDQETEGFLVVGGKQTFTYENGNYIIVEGNKIYRYDSINKVYYLQNDYYIDYSTGKLFLDGKYNKILSLGFDTYEYAIVNTYLTTNSYSDDEALEIFSKNLNVINFREEYEIEDLYLDPYDVGRQKDSTSYITLDYNSGSIYIEEKDNLAIYIDYLKDSSQKIYIRKYFYGLDKQNYTFTELENLLTNSDCSGEEDDICLLGIGNFTYTEDYNNHSVNLTGQDVISWSYNKLEWKDYNSIDTFLQEPSINSSAFNLSASSIINSSTISEDLEDQIEQDKEDIENDKFWSSILGIFENNILIQIVDAVKNTINSFSDSFNTIGSVFASIFAWLPAEIVDVISGVFMFVMAAVVIRALISLLSGLK